VALLLGATGARAVDYHVATAQDLQNALTLAAASSVSNNIYVTNGYYTGNFNFNSTNVNNLTLRAETNITSSRVVIDSGGTGSSLSMTATATAYLTVQGMTFMRNGGSGLQIAGGNTAILANGCQFLSPTSSSGIGLNLVSGLNATVTNCTAAGNANAGGGTGISISGITGKVNVQNCNMMTNSGTASGGGLYVSGATVVAVTNCLFTGNSMGGIYGDSENGNGGGAYCSGTTVIFIGNNFTGNSTAGSWGGSGNYAGNGGGVYCSGTTVILANNIFNGNINSADWNSGGGGGAACNGTTVTLTGNTFTGNLVTSYFYGGGVYCSGAVTLSGNTFANNYCNGGGGGVYSSGTAYLSNNIFSGNSAGSAGGGGVYCTGIMTLSGNTFTGNSASGSYGYGGGAYCACSVTNPIILSGNVFQQNTGASGGGLYVTGPNVNLLNNLVTHNAANTSSYQGGGFWVDASSTLNMINNTVTGNTAGYGGGAAYIVTGTVELLNVYNNIIWGNTATGNGGDVWLAGTGQKKVFDFNDADSMYGVWDIAVNNKDVSPQFFDPVNGDYHIQSTSPCKDAGTNGAPSLPATDLDGGPRIANGTVDLGCYEFSTAATHPADTNADFVITPAEYAAYAAAWKSGQTWSNAPTVIPANYVTRAGYLMTNGGAYHNDGSARPVNWKTGP
jgi:predicted outer membrane repeat protein